MSASRKTPLASCAKAEKATVWEQLSTTRRRLGYGNAVKSSDPTLRQCLAVTTIGANCVRGSATDNFSCTGASANNAPLPSTMDRRSVGWRLQDRGRERYVYGLTDSRDAQVAKSLTLDEARRIASNIAKLPELLGKD